MKKPVAIPVEKLRPFAGHPFKVKDDAEMNTLIESIQAQGILLPLIVRPIENTDEYEVISGHRRLHAAQKAGITEVPALIYALDRDAAAEVVQRLYHLCLEGKGPEQIARFLQKEKVLTPTAYYYSVGSSFANRPMPSDPYLWKDSTIDAILSNRKYTCLLYTSDAADD